MSRAFVNEDNLGHFDDLPDRPVSSHPNDVTASGLAQIDAALAAAKTAYAAAQVSQDRSALALAARDLRYWTARRSTARLVPPQPGSKTVRFGATVSIVRTDGRKQTFRIVGEDEADPNKGSISHVSPLAKSMIGKAVGDSVRAGNTEAEIVAIA